MSTFIWFASFALMGIGLVGCVLPLVPGTSFIFAGALLHRLALGRDESVGAAVLIAMGVSLALSYIIDLLSGSAGAKWFGASKWGALGGLAGTIAGLFFGPPGLLLGPLVGALLGELISGRSLLPAGKAGIGSALGTIAGMIGRLLIGLLMSVAFCIGLALH